jgi:(-)-alpha-terpineol synthase
MDQLLDYMKICFLALHNSVNEMVFDTLKEQGFHIVRYLKKSVRT